ncbi:MULTISPECIES: VWA domain-containing protein [unclassified Streptomyces]|uniref:vWA domain-containing protein n=1 Tax=unclassified Streptomyces TaxID=2593676 RepID=UPI001F04F837|nr:MULTISPECIES: VWA domain-containing protein [unclassified Streptomyces]MCH0565768.1 VWA domain-containing protein [Streptomyces sp. MUM 2J]MCH0571023.1 VWA domain-containing protein [Streptomyces sp. MUM 136J]
MSEFSNVERPPVFPVCLCIDVSYSMAGSPMKAVNDALPEIKSAIKGDPATGEIARLAVVTFSDRAETRLPLTDIAYADMPSLTPQGGTNFDVGLRASGDALRDGIRALGKGSAYHQPVIFFISDGEHNAAVDWTHAWAQVTSKDDRYGAQIVSFGFGQANRDAIRQVSTGFAFFTDESDPGAAVREILRTVVRSIRTTSSSFSSASGGVLSVPLDGTKLTQLPLDQRTVS